MTRQGAVDQASSRPSRWVGLLVDHDFRVVWIGETASALGTNISRLALPLVAVGTLHASAFAVSMLAALTWLPWLVVGLPAGAWVDRAPRRPVMLACNGVSFLVLVSVPLAAWTGVLTFAQLLVVALLVGLSAVFFQTAYQVYLPGLVAAQDLPEANAKLQGSEAAAQVAGPGVAGLITQAVGAVVGVLADAVSFAISALCLVRVRAPERTVPERSQPSAEGLRRQVAEGLSFLVKDPYLRVLAVYGALSNLALTGYQAILVVFLIREVGADAAVGVLVAGMSVGGLLGATLATTIGRRLGTSRGMLIANCAAGPFALLIPLTALGPRLALVVLGGIGVGTAVVAGNVLKVSFRQTYTPRWLLGRVVSGMQFLNYGTIPIGALLGGTLATYLGLRPTIWMMASGLSLAAVALFVGPLKKRRDFPLEPAAPA